MGARLNSDLRCAPAQVLTEQRADGTILLRSPQRLATHARAAGERLAHWGARAPGRAFLAEALKTLAAEAGTGGPTHPTRNLIMNEPPSIDANEITDKGYVNQHAVLERRAAPVRTLYSGGPEVVAL